MQWDRSIKTSQSFSPKPETRENRKSLVTEGEKWDAFKEKWLLLENDPLGQAAKKTTGSKRRSSKPKLIL